jgi:RNA polymerase sigma-70 factor, ECF subfamily
MTTAACRSILWSIMADLAMDVRETVVEAHRQEWAAVLAATVRITRDIDLAEECAQDAFAAALERWPSAGISARPGAWLTTAATNRARDLLRRESTWRRLMPMLVVDDDEGNQGDDTLRLIFTCCHPALAQDAQVALTLRLICGLSAAEIARAYLVQETTMAARITRAKKKIAAARIPYRIPTDADLPARAAAVCEVLHLVFTTGHTAPTGDAVVRTELVDRAMEQTRRLHRLLPRDREVTGLLALMLLIDARRDTRQSGTGELELLQDQDRSRWDHSRIAEGAALVRRSLRDAPPSRYAVEAAIAAVHAEAPSWENTDWGEIVGLYDVLGRLWPSPVVDLNRAIAIGFRDGPQAGLGALEPLLDEPALGAYPYLSAARADLLRRLGRAKEARTAYEEALALTDNSVGRKFLARRLDALR